MPYDVGFDGFVYPDRGSGGGRGYLPSRLRRFRRRKYRIVMFFLATQFDGSVLDDVVALAADINAMTGPSCLAILFMPKGKGQQRRSRAGPSQFFPNAVPIRGGEGWEAFSDSMTRGSYEIARYFSVPPKHLPCILFFSVDSGDEFAVFRLGKKGIRDVYPSLRKVFFDWYAHGNGGVSLDQARMIVSERPSHVEDNVSDHIRELVADAVRTRMLQPLAVALDQAVKPAQRRAVSRVLRALETNPLDVTPLSDFLATYDITANVNGVTFTPRNGHRSYDLLYGKLVSRVYRAQLQSARFATAPFPLERISQLDRRAYVIQSAVKLADTAKSLRPAFSFIKDVRKLLPV